MNALLVFAAIAAPQVSVLEVPISDPGVLHVEAIVRTPTLDAEELAVAQALINVLPDGTISFSRYKLLEYGTLITDSIRYTMTPDAIRISMSFPDNQPLLAASVTSSLLREARLDEEVTKRAIAELPFRRLYPWHDALQPEQPAFAGLRPIDVKDLYRKLFRPENITVAVSGSQVPEFRKQIMLGLDTWRMPPYRSSRYRTSSLPRISETRRAAVTTYELAGPEFEEAEEFPKQLLTGIALGSGKGASLFRVLREKHGWTYRQEAVLFPTEKGFRLRLIAAGNKSVDDDDRLEQMKAALIEDVKAWTEDDLSRAQGMVSVIFDRAIDFSPLYLTAARPLSQSAADRVFFHGYWFAKTSRILDLDRLRANMKAVTLDELRATALKTLEESYGRTIRGTG